MTALGQLPSAADDGLPGNVYLIACPEPLSVKIGYTRGHPRFRLQQLQTGCPSQLTLVGWYPGSPADEAAHHRDLATYRMCGEWFELDAGAERLLRGIVTLIKINNRLTGFAA